MNNMKKVYAIVRDAVNEDSNHHRNLEIMNDAGEKFNTDDGMADFCNDYFVNVGLHMKEKISIPCAPCELGGCVAESMFLKPVTEAEVIKHIHSLKNNSSPGYDNIPASIIKHTHAEIINPLLHIINQIFVTGIVPSHFKTSVVVPVFKNGSRTDIRNF